MLFKYYECCTFKIKLTVQNFQISFIFYNMAKTSNKGMKRGAAHHFFNPNKVEKKKYVPVANPKQRGRKKMAPEDRKTKPYVPSGKPRGRPAKTE